VVTQRPCPIEGVPGEASDADSISGSQHVPTASTSSSVSSCSISGPFLRQVSPAPTVDNHFMVIHGMKSWAAFTYIALMLELVCTQDTGFHIRAPPDKLPPPIAPTLKQQIVPHRTYVDTLPWSSLRDRILSSVMTINEDELFFDLASGDLKVWGSTPWDPAGWEVGPNFARKWWFLMDDGIMRMTNFWRAQRGEEALVLVPL